MQSIAHQSETQLGGRFSVLVRQRRDHIKLDQLLEELEATPAGPGQDAVLQEIARLVFPHAFAEEAVLWPVLRRVLSDGEELTLRVEQEHQEVNELWAALEGEGAPGAELSDVLARLAEVLREDVRDEEDVLLPRLQRSIGAGRLRLLGIAWEAVRRIAPTRPHPVVARRPPGNALAAAPLSVLDRGRDRLDAGARRRGSSRMETASQALARGAAWVEHLGVMRRGEDRSTHRE